MFDSALSSVLFTILKIICWAIDRLTQLFSIFSGLTKVSYKGEPTFLFDVFLNNSAINNIYWGMALIGIALCFVFTIASVVRKLFDVNGKQQMSMGQILTEALKSIFIILGMNLILSVALTGTDVLLRQVNYLFLNADKLNRSAVVEFTNDQYAAMGRALSTIANYGMNPSYNSRYNINDCFNTIRPDLVYLEDQGVFDYAYPSDGVNTWQSVLQEVAHSADLRYDLKGDVYYESVAKALEHALTVIRSDASFRPLERFEEQRSSNAADVPLDRIVFLMGTLDAANNNFFNRNPSFSDALRLPYYTGEKSLYDTGDYDSLKVINGDFDISYSRFDYFVSFVMGIAVLYNTLTILLALIARMFNILFLYIIAPPVLAVRPLDGGGKTRQWVNAFIIQLLGVFGSIIVIRLLLIFVPVIYEPGLVLISGSPIMNYFAKAIMLIAAYAVAKKAGSLLSGILSDTAAMQSMQAGDMTSTAQRVIGTTRRAVGTAVRTVGAAVGGAVGFAAAPATNAIRKPFDSYRRMGSGASVSDIRRQAKERLAVENMVGQMRGASDKSGDGSSGGHLPPRGGQGNVSEIGGNRKAPGGDPGKIKAGSGGSGVRERSMSVSQPVKRPNLPDGPGGGQPRKQGNQPEPQQRNELRQNDRSQPRDVKDGEPPRQVNNQPPQQQVKLEPDIQNRSGRNTGSLPPQQSGQGRQQPLPQQGGTDRRPGRPVQSQQVNNSGRPQQQYRQQAPQKGNLGPDIQPQPRNVNNGSSQLPRQENKPEPQQPGNPGPDIQAQPRDVKNGEPPRQVNNQPPQQQVKLEPDIQNRSGRNTGSLPPQQSGQGRQQPLPQQGGTDRRPGRPVQSQQVNNSGRPQQQYRQQPRQENKPEPQQKGNLGPDIQPQLRNMNNDSSRLPRQENKPEPQQPENPGPDIQPQPRNMNSGSQLPRQENKPEPQQKGNPGPDIQPQFRNANNSGEPPRQVNNQPPQQQRGNSGQNVRGRSQSMDLGSRFVTEYMREVYQDLKRDADDQNS